MIEITETAARKIKSLMAKQGIADGGLRVGVKGGGCSGLSYTFGWEREPRLGNSQLLARTVNVKVDATARMTVLAHLIENGACCLSELAGLIEHHDPFGAVLHLVTTGVIALSISGGAYASDAIRAGILAIDNGIIEAAEVSGLPRRVIFARIVLPIALRTSVRPLGSVLINMILTSSILSTITLNELTGNARIVTSETFRPFEVYVVLLLVYASLTYLVSLGITVLHRWLNRDMQEQVS